ncbi:hypothetical protein, partial [Azotobacter vinelandii]|uniref:hypothetical protein n=1 Tax=Azotobacter vinelandii TaxID=354 RepID=UPI00031D629F
MAPDSALSASGPFGSDRNGANFGVQIEHCGNSVIERSWKTCSPRFSRSGAMPEPRRQVKHDHGRSLSASSGWLRIEPGPPIGGPKTMK